MNSNALPDARQITTAAELRRARGREADREREARLGPQLDAMPPAELDRWLRSLGRPGQHAADLARRYGRTGIVRLYALQLLDQVGGDTNAPRLIGSTSF